VVVHHRREAEGVEEETPVQALIPHINTVEDLPAHTKHLVYAQKWVAKGVVAETNGSWSA
jgi:hypothetical protein